MPARIAALTLCTRPALCWASLQRTPVDRSAIHDTYAAKVCELPARSQQAGVMRAACLGACGALPATGRRRHTGAPGFALPLHRPAAVHRRRLALQWRPLQGTVRPVRSHCRASGAPNGSSEPADGPASGERSCGDGGGPLWQTVLRHAGGAALVLGVLAVSLFRPPLARARCSCCSSVQ